MFLLQMGSVIMFMVCVTMGASWEPCVLISEDQAEQVWQLTDQDSWPCALLDATAGKMALPHIGELRLPTQERRSHRHHGHGRAGPSDVSLRNLALPLT